MQSPPALHSTGRLRVASSDEKKKNLNLNLGKMILREEEKSWLAEMNKNPKGQTPLSHPLSLCLDFFLIRKKKKRVPMCHQEWGLECHSNAVKPERESKS